MPTLVDRIKQNAQTLKRGTQLFDVVNESATQQAQKQGIPLGGVVTPQSSAELGVSQDQAKMAGSSAQLQNVERQALKPSTQQAQVQQFQQPSAQATQAQQANQQQARQLQQFGQHFNSVVRKATNEMLAGWMKSQSVTGPINMDAWNSAQLIDVPDQASRDKLQPILQKALAGTASSDETKELIRHLPNLSPTSTPQQIAAEINKYRNGALINDDAWNNAQLIDVPDQASRDALKGTLQRVLSGDTTVTEEQVSQLAQHLPGFSPTWTAQQVATAINQYRNTDQNSLTKALQNMPKTVTMASLSDSDVQGLGFTNQDSLAKSLGLTSDELKGMSVEDVQRKVSALQQHNFSDVQALQNVVSDPAASPAQRREATDSLRQMSVSGVQATEQDFAKVQDQVANGDSIMVDGKPMSVASFLSNDNIAAVVTAYFKGGEYASSFKAEHPELAAWMDQNQAALTAATKNLDASTKQVADNAANNAKLTKTDDGLTVSEDLNKLLYPKNADGSGGWGTYGTQLSATRYYNIINDPKIPQAWRADYSNMMNSLAKSNPDLAKTLSGYSFDQLQASGLNNPELLKQYSSYLTQATQFQSTTDNVQALSSVFPNLDDPSGLNSKIKEALSLKNSGLLDPNSISAKILDLFSYQDANGKTQYGPLDLKNKAQVDAVRQKFNQFFTEPDPNDKSTPPKRRIITPNGTDPLSAIADPKALSTELDNTLASAEAKKLDGLEITYGDIEKKLSDTESPGVIDKDELGSLTASMTAAQMQSLKDKLFKGKTRYDWGSLNSLLNEQEEKEFTGAMQGVGLPMTRSNNMPELPKDEESLQRYLKLITDAQGQASGPVKNKFKPIIDKIKQDIDFIEAPNRKAAEQRAKLEKAADVYKAKVAAADKAAAPFIQQQKDQAKAREQAQISAIASGPRSGGMAAMLPKPTETTYSERPRFPAPAGYHWSSRMLGKGMFQWYAEKDK